MSHVHHVRQGKSNGSGMHLCGGDDVLRWVHAITHAARTSAADAAVTTGAWSTYVFSRAAVYLLSTAVYQADVGVTATGRSCSSAHRAVGGHDCLK